MNNATLLRLLCTEWILLRRNEQRQALAVVRAWAREDAARGDLAPRCGWTNRYAAMLEARLGEEALCRWEEAAVADSLVEGGDGLDPREVAFSAVATETRLRVDRLPLAAARRLLRRGGQRTVNTRTRRLATA